MTESKRKIGYDQKLRRALARPIVKECIVPECEGCKHIMTEERPTVCECYFLPAAKWRSGRCPGYTNIEIKIETAIAKKRKGQQKQIKQPKLTEKQKKVYSRLGR